ncbi:MAG: O-antigen ligase family protein [Syntrophomonadaceae bacterium]|nr:O-antigen ligase family protein [Syntrophomonadaceae bacterium]
MAAWARFRAKCGRISHDIGQMQRPSELADYIPAALIEKLALFLLLVWALSPVIILILKGCRLTGYFMAGLQWAWILWQVGMFGLLLGAVALAKSLLAAGRRGENWLRPWARRHLFPLLLLLLLLWATLSAFFADNFLLSFFGDSYRKDGLFTYYSYAGIFACAYIVRRRSRLVVEVLVAVFALLALLTVLDSQALNAFFAIATDRGIYFNINHYAYVLGLAVMLAALLAMAGPATVTGGLPLRLAALALLTWALLINRSFGPYLAVIGGMALLIIFTAGFDRERLKRAVLVVAVFAVVSLGYNAVYYNVSGDFSRLFGDVGRIAWDDPDAGDAGSGRWELWVLGVEFAAERPVLGHGPDSLRPLYRAEDINHSSPHCCVIYLAATLGYPAMLLYLGAMLALTVSFFRCRRRLTTYHIGLFCAVAAWFASSLLGVSMYYTSPFYFTVLGLAAGSLLALKPAGDENAEA